MKKKLLLKKIRDINYKKGILFTLVGTNIALLNGCGTEGNNDYEGEYSDEEFEEVETFQKGVITEITENPKGVFSISNEKVTSLDSSKVVVTELSGNKRELQLTDAENIISTSLVKTEEIGKNNSLGNALLFSGVGYILAKTTHPEFSQYRPDINKDLKPETVNSADSSKHTQRRYHSGGGSSWMLHYWLWSRYYGNSGTFGNSQMVHNTVNNSRYTTFRPVGGRSGYFRSTGRTSFRG
jgi:hypothetical protein